MILLKISTSMTFILGFLKKDNTTLCKSWKNTFQSLITIVHLQSVKSLNRTLLVTAKMPRRMNWNNIGWIKLRSIGYFLMNIRCFFTFFGRIKKPGIVVSKKRCIISNRIFQMHSTFLWNLLWNFIRRGLDFLIKELVLENLKRK